MISLSLILLILLGIVALIDWKFKAVPSIFLSGLLFITLALRIENVAFGILAMLLMLIVYEIDQGRTGLADFKVMGVIGLMITTLPNFLAFAIVFAVLQVIYIFLMREYLKRMDAEIPFLPVLFFTYLALLLGGMI